MDCLPEIVMPVVAEPQPEPQLEPTESEKEAEQSSEDEVVHEEPKRKLQQRDIFSDVPKVKVVKEKKKRVLSEEHKKKLADARIKALEVRRANSSQKKEMKELTKLKKTQELDKLREETGTKKKVVIVNPTDADAPLLDQKPIYQSQPPPSKVSALKGYTQEDLDKATLNAILGYEKIRKERKTIKKRDQKLNQDREELKSQLRNIKTKSSPSYDDNPWSSFF